MDIELNLTTESVAQASPAQPVCVAPEATVREVLELMKERRVGSVLVCRDEVLAGIFTERDALRILAARGDLDRPIERVMSDVPASIPADANVAAAIQRMSFGGYRRLPIVDAQNKPKGVLQSSGIVHYLVQHFPKTVYNQPPVPFPATQLREGP